MTDATELDETGIRARLEAATPGPWEAFDANEGDGNYRPGWMVANDAFHNPPEDPDAPWIAVEVHVGTRHDAEFIAHARTDVGLLLTALDEARAERLCSQCGEQMACMVKIGTTDGWCANCLDEAAEAAALARAEAAEQERDEAAAALTLQRHETSLVREARGEAMAEVEHWRALAERAWDEAVASAYLHETENWTGIKHADNPYRAALATPTTTEGGEGS